MKQPFEDHRLAKEIENFSRVLEEGGVGSTIEPIFTYWANRYLSPRLQRVFGTPDINELFASEISSYRPGQAIRALSLGSGDCSTEIDVVLLLLARGVDVHLTCTDLNPTVSAEAKRRAEQAGVADSMAFATLNLNVEWVDGQFDSIMCNHSLHHFEGLEFILGNTRTALAPGGVFVASDMIGRNGHMRWPEALPFVEAAWDYLPDTQKFNKFARCIEPTYTNYDCTSDDTFEGIRAQDILPMLLERFHFQKFVGYGNLPDVFVDRIYGGNFDPTNSRDTAFIDFLERLNTELIQAGLLKPTMMFATMSATGDVEHQVYDRWTPEFAVRQPPSAP